MIGAILLAAALHMPATHFGGYWWSEYLPVEPGKRYSFRLRREDPPDKPIWVKAFFYDEDRYPIGYGKYPKEVGEDYYFNHTWPVDFRRGAEIYTPMPEARYMRMLFTSEGVINVANWWFEESGTSSVVRVDRKYSPSAWCIVVPDRESEPIDFAAKELQHWMKEIGSERPSIVRGKAPAGKRAIYLGHDFIKDDTGRFDAWRVTKRGNDLFLASGRDEGVINAVFDLLERNTDLVFARADVNDGTVFTKTNGIRFENCEFHVEPAFEWREFGATGYAGSHLPSYLWNRRNFCNTRGDGKGKTTAAIGLAIRAAGAGRKVVFAQFFKDGSSSEIGILKTVENIRTVHCNTVRGFWRRMDDSQKAQAGKDYTAFLAEVILLAKDADLLVMDEIISACNHATVAESIVSDFLRNKPKDLEVVLTGRNPSKSLLELADYVSEIRKIKHPYDCGVAAREGIEF